jgi:hypothetical protein
VPEALEGSGEEERKWEEERKLEERKWEERKRERREETRREKMGREMLRQAQQPKNSGKNKREVRCLNGAEGGEGIS